MGSSIGGSLANSAPLNTGNYFGQLAPSQALILGGLAGGAGYAGKSGTTNTQGTQNTTGSQNTIGQSSGSNLSTLQSLMQLLGKTSTNQTQTQQLGPEGTAVFSQLFPQLQQLQPFNAQAYQGQANNNINAGAEAQSRNVDSALAARGLATSPAAAVAHAGVDASRIGAQTQVANSIPMVANQFNQGNIASIGSILAQLPRSSVTSGSQESSQEQTGNQSGSSVNSGQSSQNTQSQQNTNTTQNQQTNSGGGLGGLLGGIGGLLGTLFGLGGK